MDLELTVVQRAKPDVGYVAALAVGDDLVVAAGGTSRHAPTVLASSDARHFEPRTTPRQLGLRDVLVVDDGIWTCGEYGQLAVSRDRGETWQLIDTGTDVCLFGLALASDGAVWVAGDAGFVARVNDERLEPIDVGTTSRLTAIYCIRDEAIALGVDGVLYRWRGGVVTQVATGATRQLNALTITKHGSWLAIGDGGFIARSPDGTWFSRVKAELDTDLESMASLPDGRVVMVGDRGSVLVSIDDGRTWSSIATDLAAHLWTVRRFGPGVLIGGDDGIILKLAPTGDRTWDDRSDVFGGMKPLDAMFALGPTGFIDRLPSYVAAIDCEPREQKSPCADAFARIYGVTLPPEVAALFAAAGGRDCFDELRLDAALISEVGDANLFERVLEGGAIDAFCGVFCLGTQKNGDTFHMELYEWDGPRQVLHLDHHTRSFTGVVADSLDSLVYLASLARARRLRQISETAFELGVRALRSRVAPTAELDLGSDFVAFDARRRDTEFFFYRSRWICALLDGDVNVFDVPSLFMPDFNQILPQELLHARFEACERVIPTVLYAMWRAFIFDEPELDRYLEIARRHGSRLVRDAAKLVDELRDGRNTLGTITNVRQRLTAFRALGLDPRRKAEADARARTEAKRRAEVEAELARTPRASWTDLAWRWIDDGVAHRALLAKLADIPELAAQIARLDELRLLSDHERELALPRLAAKLAPELEAILVGSVVRTDDLAGVLADTRSPVVARRTKTGPDLQAALRMTERALRLIPGDNTTEYTHALLLLEAGRVEDVIKRWPQLSSHNQQALVDRVAPALNEACLKAHAMKAYDDAVRLAQHAQSFASSYPYLHHSAACAFAAVGDYARAFEQVKLAIEHNSDQVAALEIDSDLGPLLDWPEFKALFRDWHARKEDN
jgi:photosystem II stability/assembly factor-like uncharacterized protein/tetratricopeptide (TPR) repeat protein